jgi:hypothetical protein
MLGGSVFGGLAFGGSIAFVEDFLGARTGARLTGSEG